MTTILCAVFFLSGASALIFESLWFQLSGLTFGNSVWATSIVLSSFMAGLALGNLLVTIKGYKIKSPIHFYALLEIVIAITGLGLVLAFPYLTKIFVPLFRVIIDHPLLLNATRAAIAMGLMIIPATAMGMTLPLLVKALYKENPNFGRVLGLLYGWNTLGAVAGVMVSELYLIKWFGIRGAGMAAAFFNLIAAFTALWLSKRFTQSYPAQTISEPKPIRFHISFESGRILIAGFLSGFILLALEVIWFRFMILFWDPNSYNFAVMLAVVLGGISLGGICASRLFTIKKDVHHFLPEVFFTNALLIIILYTNFSQVIKWLENLSKYPNIVIASLILMFPISFVSGIIFTMLGRALHIKIIGETKTTGLLTFANTIGGMTGSLVAGLLLIPVMGLEKSYLILSCMYGMTGFLLFLKKQHRFANIAFAATFLISLAIFPFNIMVSQYLDVSIPPSLRDSDEKRVAFREGMTETIQYLRYDLLKQPDYYRLITNSYSMSGTNKYSKRYMKLYVYWPMAIHPNPQKALLICYGCGSTAKAMTDSKKLKSIDIVDTSKDVIEMGSIVYPDPKENPVNDPRVNIHIEDGRFFLLTNEKQYDLITAEPPPPKNSGVVNLYSQEYFQLAYNRLSDGGIMTYWLPVYQLKPEETKSILKAFTNVFKETSLWVGTGFEWMMVGIKNPDKKASMNDSFEAQWKDPVVCVEMIFLGFMSTEQFGSLFIADSERLVFW
ncbi:MAG: spermidine synthase, partial [Desulfobacteraceae bacterium]|nr:spermidine synthase [Desulfobacteraceae bacterium]